MRERLQSEGKNPDSKILILLKDIKEDKPNAVDRFLQEIQQTVLNFGMKVCGGKVEDAEDTMQEVLLQFFKGAKKLDFNDPSALRVWLYKVAKNACLMSRRRGKDEPKYTYSLDDTAHKRSKDDGNESVICDSSNMPDKAVQIKENVSLIEDALQKIPIDYRLVLILRDMEDLSTKEASDILEISESNVKVKLHRARLMMREELLSGKNLIGEDVIIDEKH